MRFCCNKYLAWGSGFGNEQREKAGGILQNTIEKAKFPGTDYRNTDVEDPVGEASEESRTALLETGVRRPLLHVAESLAKLPAVTQNCYRMNILCSKDFQAVLKVLPALFPPLRVEPESRQRNRVTQK